MVYLLVFVLLVFLLYRMGARWAVRLFPDEVHFLPLDDGRRLALYRVRPAEGAPRKKHPAILCHGLGAHHLNLALPGKNSLAERLAREGYDVFCPDLSGSGRSVHRAWFDPRRCDVSFDDYVDRDGPAIIRHVLDVTGAKKVFWVGHSMGGMIAYGLGQFEIARKIHGVVAIASPGTLDRLVKKLPIVKAASLLKPFPCIHQLFFVRQFVPLMSLLPRRTRLPMLNMENMELPAAKHVAASVLSTTSTKLLLQFSEWIKKGEMISRDGYDYWENLPRFNLPVLLFAGGVDFFAPPASVEGVFKRIGSRDKTFVLLSKEEGGKADYGHGDIIFGRTAPDEVFSRVVDWANERDG